MKPIHKRYQQMLENGPSNIAGWMVFWGLWPLSCFYRLVVALRKQLFIVGFKSVYHASTPVISVGNITVGGTGKTPMVDFLVKHFHSEGKRVAIVSRGYGGRYRGAVGKVNAPDGSLLMTAEACGDEPYLLARRNPGVSVFVARRRRDGVEAAEEAAADLIVLDDGFQHLAVHREADIVLLDSNKPFGNGHLLPAGPLRETPDSLNRCHLMVRTRSDKGLSQDFPQGKETLVCCHSLADELISLAGDVISWEDLRGKRCTAFAGIAQPQDFFSALRQKNLNLVDTIAFDDHQAYSSVVLNQLNQACNNSDLLITTEKDAVKLIGAEFSIPCYQTQLNLAFEDVEQLKIVLDGLIRRT